MSERVGRTVRGVVLSAVAGAAFATLAAPPARAQTAPRPVRVPLEPQFERLRRTIDSLDRLLATGNLSLAERRTVGSELDRRIAEFNQRRERTEGQGPSDVVIHLRSQMSRLQRGDGVLDDLSQSIMAQNAAPRGWVGIMVDGAPQERWVERGELFVRYFSYPRVLSVDPSSPAQRAGFIPNDELLA